MGLHFSILCIVKIERKPEDVVLLKRSKKDKKTCGSHDDQSWHVTVRECDSNFKKSESLERLFLQLTKQELTNLDKFLPLNYHKILNSSFLFPLLEFQNRSLPPPRPAPPPIKMYRLKSWLLVAPSPLYKKGWGGNYVGENYLAKQKEIKQLVVVSWPLRGWESLSVSVKKVKSVIKILF